MARRYSRFGFVQALSIFVTLTAASMAGATGYWNVPSNSCQWLGYGYGGGYHAKFILGPITYECLYPPNEVRLPYAPNPYACQPCYDGCGSGYGAGTGPTMMEPVESAAPLFQPVAAPSARLPVLFVPPVQR